jgi:ketosteroid isomerase-like protein
MATNDESKIKRWFDRYLTSVEEGDVDTYLSSWSNDVIFLPPNQGALKGKDSIRGVAEGIKRSFVEPKIIEQEIGVSGDVAFARNLVS